MDSPFDILQNLQEMKDRREIHSFEWTISEDGNIDVFVCPVKPVKYIILTANIIGNTCGF